MSNSESNDRDYTVQCCLSCGRLYLTSQGHKLEIWTVLLAMFVVCGSVSTITWGVLAGDCTELDVYKLIQQGRRLGPCSIHTWFTWLLFCIDFLEVYWSVSKVTQIRLLKSCLFDLNGKCTENTRILSKSYQQTVAKSSAWKTIFEEKKTVFNLEIFPLSKFN